MLLNRTSEWKVMTIWISQELPLLNFERLDILCAWIGPPSENLWPYEFLKSFRYSISDISIYYVPESDLRVKSYDHLNCSIASTVQFRASRYIIRLNRTSKWKVMTIRISRELPLFNFERLDILYAWIGPLTEKLWPFEFLEVFHCSFRASRYFMCLNRTSELKVMSIWISRELPLFNFECLDILYALIGPPSKNYDHLNISRASVVQFRASLYVMRLIGPSSEKKWPFEFLKSFRCSISGVLIYYVP